MPEAQFWAIIERSRADDPDEQIRKLKGLLTALPAKNIEAFEATFDAKMRQSYSWDLWGAAFVAMGGASDDGFEYFRLWLIARGQKAFDSVLAEPDALAAFAPSDPEELEFEALAYVAPEAWSAKTGRPRDQMPALASFFDPRGYGKPTGVSFKEDPNELAKRYPNLCRRFGSR